METAKKYVGISISALKKERRRIFDLAVLIPMMTVFVVFMTLFVTNYFLYQFAGITDQEARMIFLLSKMFCTGLTAIYMVKFFAGNLKQLLEIQKAVVELQKFNREIGRISTN